MENKETKKTKQAKTPPESNHHGILLINKPISLSSFDVIRRLRRKLNIKKMGHSGTLDPFATGLMIVLVGEAVKFQDYLMKQGKAYLAGVRLGVETDTLDPTGKVVEEKEVDFEKVVSSIDEVIAENFIGSIEQMPPQYSAIKVDGKRSYALSRKGETVKLKLRKVVVDGFVVSDFKKVEGVGETEDVTLTAKIKCGSGTYIRALARDLGRSLDTVGSLDWLERTEIGKFKLKSAFDLREIDRVEKEDILERFIQVEDFIKGSHWSLKEEDIQKLKFGNFEFLKTRLDEGFNILFFKNRLVGVMNKVTDSQPKEPILGKEIKLHFIYNLVKFMG